MFRLAFFLVIGLIGLPVSAGPDLTPAADKACQQQIVLAEKQPNAQVYTDCGFSNEKKAWEFWGPFATAHNLKRAMFELCQRHPGTAYGTLYCQKVLDLNFGPALLKRGDLAYRSGHTDKARTDYTAAIKSGDLTRSETRELTEKLGILYLTADAESNDPQSGIALLTKAANDRSAVANNALGYLVFAGKYGLKQNSVQALDYIWRAILLGCPAAEENLGAFHLARQGKISTEEAIFYMSQQAFSCTPFDKAEDDDTLATCACSEVLKQEQYFQSQPYLFLDMPEPSQGLFQARDGSEYTIHIGESLPDGTILQQLKPTLATLFKNGDKILLNRYQTNPCVDKCLKYAERHAQRQPIRIRPYHLNFTPQECDTLTYYAERLIDTKQDYVGKKECNGGNLDEAAQLLLFQD